MSRNASRSSSAWAWRKEPGTGDADVRPRVPPTREPAGSASTGLTCRAPRVAHAPSMPGARPLRHAGCRVWRSSALDQQGLFRRCVASAYSRLSPGTCGIISGGWRSEAWTRVPLAFGCARRLRSTTVSYGINVASQAERAIWDTLTAKTTPSRQALPGKIRRRAKRLCPSQKSVLLPAQTLWQEATHRA